MKRLTMGIVLGFVLLTGLLMAGDDDYTYTRVDALKVKHYIVVDKAIVVEDSVMVHKPKGSVSGKISVSKNTALISVTSDDNKTSVSSIIIYDKAKKQHLASITIRQGKQYIAFEIVNGQPLIHTNKTIINLDKLFGNGISKKSK